MFLASIHLAPALTITLGIALSGVLVWYWRRLGRLDVPASRRMIRRFSLAIMLISLPMFVRALSFVDPEVEKRPYVVAWTAATVMVLLMIATALLDAINNLRLHREQQHQAMTDTAVELARAIRERRGAAKTPRSADQTSRETGA